MDQVLMSVKKTFTDEPTPARLPDSVRAQQRRLKTIRTRRRELPDPPVALLRRGQTGDSGDLPEVVLRRRVQTDVPPSVEINAVRRSPTASGSEASRVEPAARWGNRGARKIQRANGEQSILKPLTDTVADNADWDSLKSGLRMVLDEWVERQRANETETP